MKMWEMNLLYTVEAFKVNSSDEIFLLSDIIGLIHVFSAFCLFIPYLANFKYTIVKFEGICKICLWMTR